MRTIKYPERNRWNKLVQRPVKEETQLKDVVADILSDVRTKGDRALFDYTKKLDGIKLNNLAVSDEEIQNAIIPADLEAALLLAKRNIETFHRNQIVNEPVVETTKGVRCWRKSVGIEKVGLYIPGGSAPLFSTVLMLGTPAQLAGCNNVMLCTPPNAQGQIDPAILVSARMVGINQIFKVGGAQAIAAMAYGTASVPQVYKIFGPGNKYVTKAKELVQEAGLAIDMPAGPSEVLIIADEGADPQFVAADLLSQAEHGADSQVVLLSTSEKFIAEVNRELSQQISLLPRRQVAELALNNSFAVALKLLSECLELSNQYAPEHLILATQKNDELMAGVTNAGSVFIGTYSCESAGDYASGTNHTLPTNGYAKSYSGVSVDSFVKKITFQELTSEGIQHIGPAIEKMAEAEQLLAHKNAVTLRLKKIASVQPE